MKQDHLPDVVLVRKVYADKATRNHKRRWKLRHLGIDEDASSQNRSVREDNLCCMNPLLLNEFRFPRFDTSWLVTSWPSYMDSYSLIHILCWFTVLWLLLYIPQRLHWLPRGSWGGCTIPYKHQHLPGYLKTTSWWYWEWGWRSPTDWPWGDAGRFAHWVRPYRRRRCRNDWIIGDVSCTVGRSIRLSWLKYLKLKTGHVCHFVVYCIFSFKSCCMYCTPMK